MRIDGKAIKLGNSINTDFIISGRYKFSITDMKELAKHIMEDIDPSFPSKIIPGRSVIVAGKNFRKTVHTYFPGMTCAQVVAKMEST